MIQIGKTTYLKVIKNTPQGYYLTDEEHSEELLLPVKYIPVGSAIGDEIKVFVYHDNEGRPICTTLVPLIQILEFACLEVKSTTEYGAFLDMGIAKDLFAPISEQKVKMYEGQKHIVFMYVDEQTGRLTASSKINQFLEQEYFTVDEGEEVDLLIYEETDLGYNAIINNIHKGVIYYNEIFDTITFGEKRKGYIKKIREDNKIDLALQQQGYSGIEANAQKILKVLNDNEGFLNLTDKSEPEEIINLLKMSKKTFKKAIGSLYKSKLIRLDDKGISLVKKK